MPPDDPDTEADWSLGRRSMLSLLGVGAGSSIALSRGLGDRWRTALAGQSGARAANVQEQQRCEPCIDPYTGYTAIAVGATTPEMPGPDASGNETLDNQTTGNETIGNESLTNQTTPTPGNETNGYGTTPTPGNETLENESADNETLGNETAGQTPTPIDAAEVFDPVLTVELRVSDADVVFQEEGPGESDGNQTAPPDGNETVGPDEDNETGRPIGDNETIPSEEDNETGPPDYDNETGAPDETGDNQTEPPIDDNETGPADDNQTAPGDEEAPEEGEEMGPFGAGGFPDFYFDPVGFRLRPGDVVAFETVEELHTVTAYHPRFFGMQQRVPDGVGGFTSPVLVSGDTWYYRFDEPGVYDMFCFPHEELGMVCRAVVLEEGEDAPEGYDDPGEEAPAPSPISLTVLNADELEPGNVVEQESVAWTDLSGVESEPPFEGP